MPEDGTDRIAAGAYGADYERLTRLKKADEPESLFRANLDIRPPG